MCAVPITQPIRDAFQRRFTLISPHYSSCLRLARGRLLLLPEKVDSRVTVTLMVQTSRVGKKKSVLGSGEGASADVPAWPSSHANAQKHPQT